MFLIIKAVIHAHFDAGVWKGICLNVNLLIATSNSSPAIPIFKGVANQGCEIFKKPPVLPGSSWRGGGLVLLISGPTGSLVISSEEFSSNNEIRTDSVETLVL